MCRPFEIRTFCLDFKCLGFLRHLSTNCDSNHLKFRLFVWISIFQASVVQIVIQTIRKPDVLNLFSNVQDFLGICVKNCGSNHTKTGRFCPVFEWSLVFKFDHSKTGHCICRPDLFPQSGIWVMTVKLNLALVVYLLTHRLDSKLTNFSFSSVSQKMRRANLF